MSVKTLSSKHGAELQAFSRAVKAVLDGDLVRRRELAALLRPATATTPSEGGSLQPPAPASLSVTGGFNKIVLEWPGSADYQTEVWRAEADDLGAAGKIHAHPAEALGIWVDTPPESALGKTYWYWVRYLNGTLPGPYNAVAGTPGATADDPAYVLELLRERITASQLHADLSAPIGKIPALEAEVAELAPLPEAYMELVVAKDTLNARTLENAAAIQQEATVRANETGALAQQVTTVQTAVDGHTASIQTHSQSIDGLEAQHVIKTQVRTADGKLVTAGIGLASGADGTSEVLVKANQFAIVPDDLGSTEVALPFVVVDGKVYIDTALIREATIKGAMIENLAVDNAKIADLSVEKLIAGIIQATGIYLGADARVHLDGQNQRLSVSDGTRDRVWFGNVGDGWGIKVWDADGGLILSSGAGINVAAIEGLGDIAVVDKLSAANITTYIEAGAINYALIGDAEVGTLKIQGNAVTVPLGATVLNDLTTTSTGWVSTNIVLTIPIPAEAPFPVVIVFDIEGGSTGLDGTNIQALMRLVRNGVVIGPAETLLGELVTWEIPEVGPRSAYARAGFARVYVDSPGAGTWTYEIQLRASGTGGGQYAYVGHRSLVLLGAKR